MIRIKECPIYYRDKKQFALVSVVCIDINNNGNYNCASY